MTDGAPRKSSRAGSASACARRAAVGPAPRARRASRGAASQRRPGDLRVVAGRDDPALERAPRMRVGAKESTGRVSYLLPSPRSRPTHNAPSPSASPVMVRSGYSRFAASPVTRRTADCGSTARSALPAVTSHSAPGARSKSAVTAAPSLASCAERTTAPLATSRIATRPSGNPAASWRSSREKRSAVAPAIATTRGPCASSTWMRSGAATAQPQGRAIPPAPERDVSPRVQRREHRAAGGEREDLSLERPPPGGGVDLRIPRQELTAVDRCERCRRPGKEAHRGRVPKGRQEARGEEPPAGALIAHEIAGLSGIRVAARRRRGMVGAMLPRAPLRGPRFVPLLCLITPIVVSVACDDDPLRPQLVELHGAQASLRITLAPFQLAIVDAKGIVTLATAPASEDNRYGTPGATRDDGLDNVKVLCPAGTASSRRSSRGRPRPTPSSSHATRRAPRSRSRCREVRSPSVFASRARRCRSPRQPRATAGTRPRSPFSFVPTSTSSASASALRASTIAASRSIRGPRKAGSGAAKASRATR